MGIKYLDPTNEQFVVGLFSRVHEKLGFKHITRLKTSYPDAEVEDYQGKIKRIEFEYNSSSFRTHKQLADLFFYMGRTTGYYVDILPIIINASCMSPALLF